MAGAAIGFLLTGPIGAVVGAAVGHVGSIGGSSEEVIYQE